MLTAPSTSTNQQDSNTLPVWLSIPIILICLAGGGWIIHWYVMTDPLSHEVRILGDAPPAPAQWTGPGGGNNFNPRFITERNGRYDARTEEARMAVTLTNGKLKWNIITYLGSYPFVPEDAKNTIFSARWIVSAGNERVVTALKLTPDQVKRLKGLVPQINMEVSPSDRAELAALMEAYIQAPDSQRPAIEPKVLEALDAVAQKSQPATRQMAVERAAQINAIITPEQWQLSRSMGGR